MRRPWPRPSIKLRLMLWYTTVLLIVLAVNGAVILALLHRRRYADLDRRLREEMEVAEQMIEGNGQGALTWRANDHDDADEEAGPGILVEVWDLHGTLLLRRDFADLGNLSSPPPTDAAHPSFTSVTTGRGTSARVVTWNHVIRNLPVRMRIARSEEAIKDELAQVVWVMLLAFPLAACLAGLGGYLLAGRVLAPLNRIVERAKTISADRLSDRILVDHPDDELGRLAGVLNDAFSRLDRSFNDLRRFTADASHELRTPLTAMRSVGEVALRKTSGDNTCRDAISSMLEEVDRLSLLVNGLLTLSRADAGRLQLRRESVDLATLAQEVIDYLRVLAEEKRQSLVLQVADSPRARMDRGLLRQALINLVDNAINYSPAESTIRVAVRVARGCPVVEVMDEGPGIPAKDRGHVFERFFRMDKARSRKTDGTGLGLAIAKWAVEVNGGRIELESKEGAGSTFRIVLPAPRIPPEEQDHEIPVQ